MSSLMNSPVKIETADLPHIFKSSRRYQFTPSNTLWAIKYVCNFDFRVRNYSELCSLLETMRYWMFDNTPTTYFDAIFSKKHLIKQLMEENTRDIALRFPNFRPLFETSILVDDGTAEEKHRVAIENGYFALAEYLCQSAE
jgi:hypothetical protein